MERNNLIPLAASRLAVVLQALGYGGDNPFVPEIPVPVRQTVDMPGVLDFYEDEATALWPEEGTVRFSSAMNPECAVTDTDDDYGNGNYVRSWWDPAPFERILKDLLRTVRAHGSLSSHIAEAVPVGTLVLPPGTTVNLSAGEEGTEPYELLEVTTERDEPLIRYRRGADEYRDLARDLPAEDLAEVAAALRIRR